MGFHPEWTKNGHFSRGLYVACYVCEHYTNPTSYRLHVSVEDT